MIKQLRVRNFLSLKDVDLELGTRNLLVGPNMSGKSNLIDCFRFLTTRRPPEIICQTNIYLSMSKKLGILYMTFYFHYFLYIL